MDLLKKIKHLMQLDKNSNSNCIEIGRYAKLVLRKCFLWPITLKDYIVGFFVELVLTSLSFGLIGHLVHIIRKPNWKLHEIIDDLTISTAVILMVYIHAIYFYAHPQFMQLRHDISDFSIFRKPKNIEKLIKLLDVVYVTLMIFFVMMLPVALFYYMLEDCEDGVESICGLMFTAYLPFVDVYTAPYRQIMLFHQTVVLYAHFILSVSLVWSYVSVLFCYAFYLKELQGMIEEIPLIDDWTARKSHLINCIIYHKHILSLHKCFFNITRRMLMIFLIGLSVIVSLGIYQLLSTKSNFTSSIHLGIWVVLTLLVSIAGEQLITESLKLPQSIFYSIPWDGDVKLQKLMLYFLMKTQKPLYLEAGKFAVVGIRLYMTILKSSYTFLALIIQLEQT